MLSERPSDLDRISLRDRLDGVPRERLANLPTPLMRLRNASEDLGVDVWIKRDDMTGLAFGGNKTRILEFSIAQARSEGADLLIAAAYAQSNHVRQAAAAAIRVGMPIHLVCCVDDSERATHEGNYLLSTLMGVSQEIVPISDITEIPAAAESVAARYRSIGAKPIIITGTYTMVAGPLAYINAAIEVLDQFDDFGERYPDYVVACSTSSTQAGLAAAGCLLGIPWRTIGIAPAYFEQVPMRVAAMANAAAKRLSLPLNLEAHDIWNDDRFVGPRYGIVTEASRHAVQFLAEREAIFLDPVYGGKAFAALRSYIAQGRIDRGSRVLFIHTGGTPILFEKGRELAIRENR